MITQEESIICLLIEEKAMQINNNSDFSAIKPYTSAQVFEALKYLETNEEFIKGIQFFYPDWQEEDIIQKLRSCKSTTDFQVAFIKQIINRSIQESMSSFKIIGLDTIEHVSNSLYISNHRDIFLDSALLQNHLNDIGEPLTEISLGNNLIVNDTMMAVAKLNNMFTVIRNGTRAEMLSNSKMLSGYLRYAITEKEVSAWIAQGNGRTKDGNDVTAKGLIKMLLMSGESDVKKAISELNIVVSTISFEYEPCAFEKANELSLKEKEGEYVKRQFENIYSIINGIKDYKGNVNLVFEKLNVNHLNFTNNVKKDSETIAKEIDSIVYKNYQLNKTNYMAHDLLYNDNRYRHYYTQNDIEDFDTYLLGSRNEDIYYRVLKMYVNPIINKEK